VAIKWYKTHLAEAAAAMGGNTTPINVVLVTNDEENRRKALEEGLDACSGNAMK
jgi:hypothetical protein